MKTKKVKKKPLRKCVGCHEMKLKTDLIRVVRTSENLYEVDKTGKKNGRGAYICNDISCFEKAKKSRALERSFGAKIDSNVYELLQEVFDE